MRILKLDSLKPGDVILETGYARGGATWGHASLVMGKLFRIEAGKDDGVEMNVFPLMALRNGDQRIVGMLVDDDILVRRPTGSVDEGRIAGGALAEAGRGYSFKKVLELDDVPGSVRAGVERKLQRNPEDPGVEGRMCSEVVARVLELPSTVISPDALAKSDRLSDFREAVIDLDPRWIREEMDAEIARVEDLVGEIETGIEQRAMTTLKAIAARKDLEGTTPEEAVAALEAELDAELCRSIGLFQDVRALEPEILGI